MKNQQFFNATFIARKARVLRNGEVPIILRISIAGQRAELNINRTVKPDMWVAAKGMSKGKSRALYISREDIHQLVHSHSLEKQIAAVQ